jgi:hypothetical protein
MIMDNKKDTEPTPLLRFNEEKNQASLESAKTNPESQKALRVDV